jgi:hypothetical protein
VTSQGGTTREGFLAVGVRALVRSLARVDAAMASQRAGVAEWLGSVSVCVQRMELVLTYLSTTLAHMRLLTRVDALVHCQGGALDELLAAVGVIAHVRTNAAVNTFCKSQCVLCAL